MNPSPFTRKPIPVQALQFDGTIPTLLAIFNAAVPDPAGVQVTISFDGAGRVGSVGFTGAHPLSFSPGDWVVMPDDPGRPLFAVTAEQFARDWQ
jgi:hypothetical protein